MTLAPPIEIDDPTAARFAMYRLLADALEFPSREFFEEVRCGAFLEGARAVVGGLPYGLDAEAVLGSLLADGEYVDFQAEYIRLFDVGAVRPPCPLYGGEWGMPRRRSMEDALRFYRFFGLKMSEGAHELPDHVTVELEFMQVMAHTEGEARARDGDPAPLLRAERDFLARHLGRWWPLLRRRLATQQPPPFYEAITALAATFFAADHAYLSRLAAEG
jgi:DMSO reductase family type II enzyme chaperone